ncbi:MAG: hypothetical protein GXY43_01815 [Clostridiaceae bacterium]|nr:hypothetical protein [Clostridiaceae bacterium]
MSSTEIPKREGELGIRDFLKIFWKGRILIIVLTIAALLISGVLSLFILPKEYRATATISVSPQKPTPSALGRNVSIDDPFNWIATKTKADYMSGLLSEELLKKINDELGLNDSPASLRSAIMLRDVPGSALIDITVTRSDPEDAQNIARAVCEYSREIIAEEHRAEWEEALDSTRNIIENAMVEASDLKAQLETFTDEMDIPEMRAELERLEISVINQENQIKQTEIDILKGTAFLEGLRVVMESTESISWDQIIYTINTNIGSSHGGIRPSFETTGESIREALLIADFTASELRLIAAIADKAVLEEEWERSRDRIEELTEIIDEFGDTYDELLADYTMKTDQVKAYQQRRSELRDYVSGVPGQTIIRTVSDATVDNQPVRPNVLRNLLISGFLGIVLSLGILYFKAVVWAE